MMRSWDTVAVGGVDNEAGISLLVAGNEMAMQMVREMVRNAGNKSRAQKHLYRVPIENQLLSTTFKITSFRIL
jgi:hypothetical protein